MRFKKVYGYYFHDCGSNMTGGKSDYLGGGLRKPWLGTDSHNVTLLPKALSNVVHIEEILCNWKHIDFMWDLDAVRLVYKPLIKYLNKFAGFKKKSWSTFRNSIVRKDMEYKPLIKYLNLVAEEILKCFPKWHGRSRHGLQTGSKYLFYLFVQAPWHFYFFLQRTAKILNLPWQWTDHARIEQIIFCVC
jgi:hypothetical protein